MNTELLSQASKTIRSRWPESTPLGGMILGSGWSGVVDAFDVLDSIPYEEIPGLGRPGVAGHAGRLVRATGHGQEAWIFQGRRHCYEGEGWTPIALPVFVLKEAGARVVTLTNAAGGIRDGFHPGDLMVLTDHINHMGTNPLVGPHNAFWGSRFPDQSEVYDSALRTRLHAGAEAAGEMLHEGVYLAGSGPVYETPAEIRAYRALGADAVGMSTVPEALLANASGLRVVALSCITNYAAGISPHPLSHDDVTQTVDASMNKMKAVLAAYWKEVVHAVA